MDRLKSSQDAAPTLMRGLESLASCAVPEAAERLLGALARAGRAGTPAETARALDDAVILALKRAGAVDAILADLDVDAVLALVGRTARRLGAPGGAGDDALRRAAWDLLDLVRRSSLLRRIGPDRRESWARAILDLVEASQFTMGPLFRHRAQLYGSKPLFELQAGSRRRVLSWRQVASRVGLLGRTLISLDESEEPAPIAILSENSLEMALVDLACLTSRLVNVMVPANATESDVGYILGHCGAETVIVSGEQQQRKVLKNRGALPQLRRIITLDPTSARGSEVVPLDALTPEAQRIAPSAPRERSEAARIEDLASIMYTSGTTGTPKGIQFSHRNIVFKRFARGLALPEVGEEDVFLCFLPLFHTFGRFLELLGCVYWGAKYCFLSGTAADELVQGMRRHRPTVFISVPKKWMQLHERIVQQADPLEASDEEILEATRRVTGGRLQWGLSAAGHLDPEIFRFFARQGVELLSGFGMTETTGGATMTSPGEYRDGSLGNALPGIELKLAPDGELLARGPYVMMGYFDPPGDEPSFDDEGWLPSGDLMQQDPEGHYRLVDRKKEIYKNIQGETIAPQRVENLFRDFDSVSRAFLVGDHRAFNTLLVHPNPSYEELDFSSLSVQEVQEHFRSLVVSVNNFLAPYERIVDFAIIDRDLDVERGELTPKGTPRRQAVERNFAETIEQLYRRTDVRVGGVELILPNWLFQILGLTAQDFRFGEGRITLPSSGTFLTLQRRSETLAQVGSCLYRHPEGPLNLGLLLTTPELWLGNEELVAFVQLDAATRQRPQRGAAGLDWAGRSAPYSVSDEDRRKLAALGGRDDLDLLDLDLAARMLGADDGQDVLQALQLLETVLVLEEGPLTGPARTLLARLADSTHAQVRRRAFQILLPAERESRFRDLLRRFLSRDPSVLDAGTRSALKERDLSETKVDALIELTREACRGEVEELEGTPAAESLLDFLAAYGAAHPVSYRKLRAVLERVSLFGRHEARGQAARAARELQDGFRDWLGPTAQIAVDPETGQEYRWEAVVVFEEEVPQADRRRLLSAIKETAFLKEGVFLFSTGTTIRLSDIPPGGVWIRLLGKLHGKSVYRITVQTRFQGSYDLAANVNHDMTADQVQHEIHWLILSGGPGDRDPLVEDFGGYWPDQDLWSEEFIAGETLYRAMRRLARRPEQEERFRELWPFMAWSTLSAYVDFWDRSGKRLEIADPGMKNVVVPTEDYQSGVRVVSLSRRRPHKGLLAMLRTFREEFVAPAEEQYPALRGLVGWEVIFSSVLEIVGEEEGLELFRRALREADAPESELADPLRAHVREVETNGFVPMRLYFAIERYGRWAALSSDATPQARALTLQELYETYGLGRLAESYPELRIRFFRATVFRDGSPELDEGLAEMARRVRERDLAPERLIEAIDELRAKLTIDPDDEYFLARLSYPHLAPEDAAGFVRSHLRGERKSEIVVTLQDDEGVSFRVRHALNPKEVERLHGLFLAAKLDVRFRMEHHYLVAINQRGQIIAGIYYEIDESGESAHLEKIVVVERYRRKGVADGLMKELFNRLRSAGVKTVTTGFFRPEYFYGYGFRIEKRYAGLVKDL